MTAVAPQPVPTIAPARPYPPRQGPKGSFIFKMITTTDPKVLGIMYLATSIAFFLIGGLMALMMRAELAVPGMQFLSNEQFNQLFTMHGTIMLLLYATPIVFGFANYILPLQIGAPDVAFPRLNAFSYWLYLFGCDHHDGRIRHARWRSRLRLDGVHAADQRAAQPRRPAPTCGSWVWPSPASAPSSVASTWSTTVICLRAPGMTMFRHADLHLEHLHHQHPDPAGVPAADRRIHGPVRRPPSRWATSSTRQRAVCSCGSTCSGSSVTPRCTSSRWPFFGIVSEIFPVFSRKPIFGYSGLVYATLAIAALSIAVWAHHMYATGAVLLPYFSFMTFLIAVPTGVKIFNWIGTMWKGQLTFESPMLFSIGFLITFLFGGLSGVILASPPLDFHVTDSYFVVAHFHYVVFGTVVFATYAGIYFWFPKMTGRMMDERLGKWHFWTTFVGFHGTFLVQHWLGAEGMPASLRRLPALGRVHGSELGVHDLRLRTRCLDAPVHLERLQEVTRYGEVVTVDDPWGYGKLAGVGNHLPAAASQLHRVAAHP